MIAAPTGRSSSDWGDVRRTVGTSLRPGSPSTSSSSGMSTASRTSWRCSRLKSNMSSSATPSSGSMKPWMARSTSHSTGNPHAPPPPTRLPFQPFTQIVRGAGCATGRRVPMECIDTCDRSCAGRLEKRGYMASATDAPVDHYITAYNDPDAAEPDRALQRRARRLARGLGIR